MTSTEMWHALRHLRDAIAEIERGPFSEGEFPIRRAAVEAVHESLVAARHALEVVARE
jgi:hypothetical protein